MNSGLYYAFSKELTQAENELNEAKAKLKVDNSAESVTAVAVAQTKCNDWQKAVNLLYLRG
jgi:hypothetical protein